MDGFSRKEKKGSTNMKTQSRVRTFTPTELKQCNQPHNAHVAYRGKVYDVSKFIAQHPGGIDQIMLGAGRDITTVFESYHPPKALSVLEQYYVGDLIGSDVPTFPPRGKFYQALKAKVDNYFKENELDPKINYWAFLHYFLYFALAIMSCAFAFEFHEQWILSSLCAISWGFFCAQIATVSHDASHFTITHNPLVWKIIGMGHDLFLGASIYIWHHQHIIGHHVYTNIDGFDPDIVPINTEIADVRRIKDTQNWHPVYLYQHIYMPFLYGFLGVKTKLTDTYNIITMRITTTHVNPLSKFQSVIFFGGKLMHILLRLFVPYMFMDFSTVIYLNAICEASASYWLALLFETSHDNSVVEWYKPGENNKMNMDWAEMQVAATQDWSTNSWFWTKFSGAINHQLAHHLFPDILPHYYPSITPIIVETCHEFGLKYQCVDTAWKAVKCHLDHLYELGHAAKK